MTSEENRNGGGTFDTSPTVGGVEASAEAGSRLAPGAVFGRYTILQRLGAGGMGVVYGAYDPDLDRKVALKLLLSSLSGGLSQRRLLREAQAMARLSHPNVVTVHEVGEIDGRSYISMEFVEGQSLERWLAEGERSLSEILNVFLAAGQGLAAAHRAGLIHRDFKPANVLVGIDGRIRVADFGLARGAQDDSVSDGFLDAAETVKGEAADKSPSGRSPLPGGLTVPGTIIGTPRYMAPEQLLEREADSASDQFSFCLALFESLVGRPAFGSGDMMQMARKALAGDIAPIPSGTRIPVRAKKALLRGLSANPTARFASMETLLNELAHDPAVIRRRWLVAGLAAALVVAGALVVLQFVDARRNRCSGGPDRLQTVWNDERSASVARAFEATGVPYASQSADRVSALVSQRGDRWVEAYTDVCEASRIRGEASEDLLDRQMACLDQRLLELDRLLDLFEHADETICEGSVDALRSLAGSNPCTMGAEMLKLERLPSDPGKVKAIEEIRADLAEVEALKVIGKFEEGLSRAEQAVEAAEETGYAPVLGQALQLKGHIEIELGQSDEAVTSLRRALVAVEQGGDDRLGVTVLNELVWVQGTMLQEFDQANLWSELAEARLHRISDGGLLSAELLANRAAVLEVEGRYDEALEIQREAYTSITSTLGSESLEASYAENQLANALYSVGSYDEALAHYQVAADLRERYLGAFHPHVAITLSSMGSTLSNLGRNEEARAVLERALEIYQRVYGPDHPILGITLNNIAFAQEALGQLSEALETHDRALAVVQAAWGSDHPQTAFAHLNRVSIYRTLGDWDRGLEEARTAGRILLEAYGPDHPLYAYAANAEGVMLLLMGRPHQALAPLETAVRIREGVTTDRLMQAQTRFSLAKALWDSDRDRNRARRLIDESRAVFVAEGERGAEDVRLMDDWLAER